MKFKKIYNTLKEEMIDPEGQKTPKEHVYDICAWCEKEKEEEILKKDPKAVFKHSICRKCYDKEMGG